MPRQKETLRTIVLELTVTAEDVESVKEAMRELNYNSVVTDRPATEEEAAHFNKGVEGVE